MKRGWTFVLVDKQSRCPTYLYQINGEVKYDGVKMWSLGVGNFDRCDVKNRRKTGLATGGVFSVGMN